MDQKLRIAIVRFCLRLTLRGRLGLQRLSPHHREQEDQSETDVLKQASFRIPKSEQSSFGAQEVQAQFSSIEWRRMAGMRDRLIHDYGGVDYIIVWDVAANMDAELAVKLRGIIESAEK